MSLESVQRWLLMLIFADFQDVSSRRESWRTKTHVGWHVVTRKLLKSKVVFIKCMLLFIACMAQSTSLSGPPVEALYVWPPLLLMFLLLLLVLFRPVWRQKTTQSVWWSPWNPKLRQSTSANCVSISWYPKIQLRRLWCVAAARQREQTAIATSFQTPALPVCILRRLLVVPGVNRVTYWSQGMASLPHKCQPPLSSARQHPSYGDCLEVKT